MYIPLRVTKLARASKIEELFYHDDPEIESSAVNHIRKTRGADLIFLFDGYDELSRHEREKESIFFEIFNGQILQECSTIVCSRPYASEKLQRMSALTRHIEVLGFNRQQIEECIETGVKDEHKAWNLIEELKNREDLLSFCYLPLNCAILIYIYEYNNICTIPATITELFTLFLENTFQRQKDIHCTSKSDLERYKIDLSRIAYRSLLEDKLAFQEEEVPSEKEARLGLLTATKNYTRTGFEITFQFIHLTIHEYLAANWIANFTESKQAHFLTENFRNDRFRMVLIFLAGITKLKGQSVTKVLSTQNIRMYWGVATDETKDSREQYQNRFELCIQLVHEAQSQLACSALAKSIQDQMLEYRFSGNFKLNIIAYFISQSGCSWEYVFLDIVEDRWYPICFNTFVSHLQIPSRNTSIRRLSILYFNDKSTGLYPLPNVLWSLLKLKTSILSDVRYLSAGQSDKIKLI